ncbi:MAG: glycerophosphodiester phosphodiesterase [Candidatus Heimdallarchaeaceae archaeon]|jgi:glycerophosphoryl diester phosphodiesterase
MKNSKPWIIAHRGSSGEFPENTFVAFWEAIKSKTDIIEMDLQLTADEQVVIFHDNVVDRIFQEPSGKSINDFSLYELMQKEIGSWFNPKFKGLRIPILMEVLESLPQDTSLILELKSNEVKLVESVFQILEIMKVSLGVGYISVRDIETYKTCKEISSKHKIGLMQKKRTPTETIEEVVKNEVEIMQIRWENWKPEEWKLIKDLNVIVTAFCADERNEFEYLVDKKVDGILTNYPKRLYEFLNEK